MKIRILNIVSNSIFYLLILLIPSQLGLHFWPDFSFIKGIRVDYLSPTLYATDILILLLFIQFLIFNFKFELKLKILNFKLVFLTVFLLIGIMLSRSPMAGAYGLLKFLEFVFLGIYTAKNISKLKLQNILLMFSIGLIFESFLAISQYFNHGSINGIFYFFGERFFTSQTPGIANASLGGNLVLRPYGTFPHPNVLAGYLTIAMAIVISNIKYQKSKIWKNIYYFTILIGTIALFLTLSRVAIVLWLIPICLWFMAKIKNNIWLLVVLVCIGSIIFITPLGSRFTELKLTDESIAQRESLIQSSLAMIKDHPVLGVGLNNFLVNLPSSSIIQPVHNLFLLVFAETGIVGFLFFVWLIIKTIMKMKKKKEFQISNFKFQILLAVFILGLFDHYFLTLQQGQLLFSFILGLCWSDKLKNKISQFSGSIIS